MIYNKDNKEILSSLVDDFSEFVKDATYSKKLSVNELKDIIIIACDMLKIEITE